MVSEKNFHIGVKAVIVNNNKALVLKDVKRYWGYDLPGGRINENESWEEALKRELNEELGLKVFKIGKLLHVFERLDYGKKEASLMLIFFKVKAEIKEIKLSNEHSDFKWVAKKEIEELIKNGKLRNDGIKIALEKVLK